MRRGNQKDRYDLLESGSLHNSEKTSQTLLEKENEERVSLLKEKVDGLRNLAVDIGDEVRRHNTLLDEMDRGMLDIRGGFSKTMKNITSAMGISEGSGICILIVFMVLVFIFLWRMLR